MMPSFFRRALDNAKRAASSLMVRYAERAAVALPFVLAVIFAIAGLVAWLVDHFGAVTAYWLMAGGLVALGALAAAVIAVKEHEDEARNKQEMERATEAVVSEVAKQAPLAIAASLLSTHAGASSALK